MNEGCPAYTEKETINPKEAADLIRKAGGKVFLAHPVAFKYEDNLTDEEVIEIAKSMNVDGIEANYLYVDRNDNKIDDVEKWNKIAKENNWLASIGSDFHIADGLRPEVGFPNWKLRLTNDEINKLIKNILE